MKQTTKTTVYYGWDMDESKTDLAERPKLVTIKSGLLLTPKKPLLLVGVCSFLPDGDVGRKM